jgi:hypothetical protein
MFRQRMKNRFSPIETNTTAWLHSGSLFLGSGTAGYLRFGSARHHRAPGVDPWLSKGRRYPSQASRFPRRSTQSRQTTRPRRRPQYLHTRFVTLKSPREGDRSKRGGRRIPGQSPVCHLISDPIDSHCKSSPPCSFAFIRGSCAKICVHLRLFAVEIRPGVDSRWVHR